MVRVTRAGKVWFRGRSRAAPRVTESGTSGYREALSNMEQKRNKCSQLESEAVMFIIDSGMILALAAIITATSTLVWAIRRKP